MNWYAYKVLADTYDADRRAEAARHRRARQAAHAGRERHEAETPRIGATGRVAGRWSSIIARLRRRQPAAATGPALGTPGAELRPSLPR